MEGKGREMVRKIRAKEYREAEGRDLKKKKSQDITSGVR